MKSNPRHGTAAFTLIELMAVITIIVILAGLVVGGMGFVTERQANEKARVQIALLSKGLEAYKLDMGSYPLTANTADGLGKSAEALYIPLFFEGYAFNKATPPPAVSTWTKKVNSVDFPKSTTIYIADLDPTTSKQGWVTPVTGAAATPPGTTTVTDPWGTQYRYRSAQPLTGTNVNTDTRNPDFDLWSSGKNTTTKPGGTSAADLKSSADDIKNF